MIAKNKMVKYLSLGQVLIAQKGRFHVLSITDSTVNVSILTFNNII